LRWRKENLGKETRFLLRKKLQR